MDVSTPSRRPRSAESCPWQADGRFAADLPLEDYPSTMLLRLAQAIQQQVSATYARAHGLSVAEWRMLARLNSEGSVQLATLCRALAMDKAYAGRLLRSLGAQSLVTVEADPAHGRRLIVAITPAGRALARRILPQARASQEQLLQVLDPQERAALSIGLSGETAFAGNEQRLGDKRADASLATCAWHRHALERRVVLDVVWRFAVGNLELQLALVHVERGDTGVWRFEQWQTPNGQPTAAFAAGEYETYADELVVLIVARAIGAFQPHRVAEAVGE